MRGKHGHAGYVGVRIQWQAQINRVEKRQRAIQQIQRTETDSKKRRIAGALALRKVRFYSSIPHNITEVFTTLML